MKTQKRVELEARTRDLAVVYSMTAVVRPVTWYPPRIQTEQVGGEADGEPIKESEEKPIKESEVLTDEVVQIKRGGEEKVPKNWDEEYRELKNREGKPFYALDSARAYLDWVVREYELVGGETEQYSKFKGLSNELDKRLTKSKELLKKDRVEIPQTVLTSFFCDLDDVYHAADKVLFHHIGQVKSRKLGAKLVADAIKKLPKQKREHATDIMTLAAVEQEEVDAFGKKDVVHLLDALKEKKGSGEPGEEAEDE